MPRPKKVKEVNIFNVGKCPHHKKPCTCIIGHEAEVIGREIEDNSYSLSIQLGDKVLKGFGGTALEALQSITKPVKIITKGTVTMTKGDLKMTKIMQPAQIKKLFYPLAQGVLSKQLDYLMH